MLNTLRHISVSLLLLSALACSKAGYAVEDADSDAIRFSAEAPVVDFQTKASVVSGSTLDASGFYVSATTGSAGSESSYWTSTAFSKGSTYFEGGKAWALVDPGYHFYAASRPLTFNAAGTTVAATNSYDVVCAYMPSPSFKSPNALSFYHIFARVGNVTISAGDGYTISNVSVTITPKTGGTYNLRTGAGRTDGTGWSGLTTGSATEIANSTPGTKANDLYLVPGTYDLTFSWHAEKGLYSADLSKTVTGVSLVAGQVSAVTATLRGGAESILFEISVSSWGAGTIALGTTGPETPRVVGTFGGLEISAGPVAYEGGALVLKDDWNYDSYGTEYGKTEGSTYFSFVNLGQLFDNASFNVNEGAIENNLDPCDGWRLPTGTEVNTIFTTSSATREGSTVNGNINKHYARIQLTGVTHAGSDTPTGTLVFPDNEMITGKALSGMDNSTITTGFTLSELTDYLHQGCAFFPDMGIHNSSGDSWEESEQYIWTNGRYLYTGVNHTYSHTGGGILNIGSNPVKPPIELRITIQPEPGGPPGGGTMAEQMDMEVYYRPARLVREAS